MKRTAIIIFLAFIAISGCKDKSTQNIDLAELNLKGKVKMVKSLSYHAVDNGGEITKGDPARKFSWEKDNITHFNIQGYISEVHCLTPENGIVAKKIVEFNEKGFPAEESQYDANGILLFRRVFSSDAKGNKIDEFNYDSECKLQFKSSSTLDKRFNEIESTWYDSEGTIESKWKSKYDKNNNRIEMTRIDENGDLIAQFKFEYNNKGWITVEKEINSSGLEIYNKKYKYDNYGHKLEEIIQHKNGDITIWAYEYSLDKKNNWTKRIEFQNAIPKYIVFREIEYY
jgi:hypothetical protein